MQKRETWWWNKTVQEAIARKKRMFKKWQQSKAQEDHAAYKEAKRDAKRTVAVERARAAQELYEKLDTREGEKAIYRLAKSRDQTTKDNYQGYFVKAQDGTLLMKTEENICRWAEYYRDMLNKARQHTDGRNEPLTEGPLHQVTCEEVDRQLGEKRTVRAADQVEYLLRYSNAFVIGVCVNSPKSSMQSCKAARCQTNGERAPSHLSIKTRETT